MSQVSTIRAQHACLPNDTPHRDPDNVWPTPDEPHLVDSDITSGAEQAKRIPADMLTICPYVERNGRYFPKDDRRVDANSSPGHVKFSSLSTSHEILSRFSEAKTIQKCKAPIHSEVTAIVREEDRQ